MKLLSNSNRAEQAKLRGYQARLDGVDIDDNYYAALGNKYSALAAHWVTGWIMADNKLNQGEH